MDYSLCGHSLWVNSQKDQKLSKISSSRSHKNIGKAKGMLSGLPSTIKLCQVDNHMESVEWINLILERFWTVFEPALSAQVIEKVNLVLEQQKPIFLDKLMLKEFTLGSNAPCIVGTRAYRKTASNMIVSQSHY